MASSAVLGRTNAPCRQSARVWPRPIGAAAREGVAPRPTGAALTDRDVELLAHLAAGRSTAQVAAAMAITTNTVRTRVRRLEGRLAVTGRAEAVRAARAMGLV
jgi:DNA-binding CsgD family transcriptional regulator